MRRKSHATDLSSEEIVKDIRRATRKQYSAEEKIRIVLDGLRGEQSIAELCRREGIAEGLYYSGPKSSWKPASGASPATPPALRPAARSKTSGARPRSSRKSLPSRRSNCACSKKA